MKRSSSILRNCSFLFVVFWCIPGKAATIVVDSFDQGGFSRSSPGNSNPADEAVTLPFANRRMTSLGSTGAVGSTTQTTLNSTTGTLTYLTRGDSWSPQFPLYLRLVYASMELNTLSDCSVFILGFSELRGVGTLYMELGSDDGVIAPIRVELTNSGEIAYPISSIRLNAGQSLDSFNVLAFMFESRSPEFSFTLDEIRLVPEPSSVLLLAAGAGLLTRRRAMLHRSRKSTTSACA